MNDDAAGTADPSAAELPPAIPHDEYGNIATDLACRRCAYNLRGLQEAGRCPECGTPIGLSTRGDLLRFADPDWLDKVALGLKIILWMILVSILAAIAGAVLDKMVHPLFSGVLGLAAGVVAFYGVWLMTEPDPSGIGEDPNITARKVIRVTLVIGLVSQLAMMVAKGCRGSWPDQLGGHHNRGPDRPGGPGRRVREVRVLRGASGARVPDKKIVDRARFLKWAYPITCGVAVVGGGAIGALAAAVSTRGGNAAPIVNAMVCVLGPAGIALIVFLVMTVFLLFRIRRVIAEQAGLARAAWAPAAPDVSPPPPPREA